MDLRNPGSRLRAAWFAPRSPLAVALLLAAWIATVGNLALWTKLGRLALQGSVSGQPAVVLGALLLIVAAISAILLVPFAWPRVLKPVALLLLVLAGAVQHYMLAYGTVIDQSMVRNILQTDSGEMRDQLSWGLPLQILLVAALPAAWLATLPLRSSGLLRGWLRNIVACAVALAVATVGVFGIYGTLAPLVRNNMELRFMLNPTVPVLSVLAVATKSLRHDTVQPLVRVSDGAALGPRHALPGPPPLLVVVVGETARADHFGLNGYARDTTPLLAARDVTSFTDVHSCGTSTLASVPCMFSPLGKAGYESQKAEHETLLDVLQAAGLGVLWLDNQAGCKGVCDRVPHASTADPFPPAESLRSQLCAEGDCLDRLMLAGLDQRIAALPAERRQHGVVLVLHQMGSHGPAYWKRSAADTKRFRPECATVELAQCATDTVVNAFDNSIAETDRFLAQLVDWLATQQTAWAPAMVYMSDHGESLGELGVYLHGVPYAFAPEAQKHVPMVLWLSRGMAGFSGTDAGCVRGLRSAPFTHDNLYPTVLGLVDVVSPTYRPALDAFAPCRGDGKVGVTDR